MTAFQLNKGDTIGVFAPSSRVDIDSLKKAAALIEAQGYKLFIHPQTYNAEHQSAGTGKEKAAAFHDLLKDTNIKAVLAAKGGNRAYTMLEHIDWSLVKNNPKPLIGFSDVTTLLNAVYTQTQQAGLFAADLQYLNALDESSVKIFFEALGQKTIKYNLNSAKILNSGLARSTTIGGTLTVFQNLIGTKHMPNPQGKILLLEDTYEETSRLDRALWQLKKALPFEALSGIIFGNFSKLQDTGRLPFGFSLEDIIREHTAGLNIPIIMNAPFGHCSDFHPLPLGKDIHLAATKDTVTISF